MRTLVNDGTDPFRGGTVLRIEGEPHHRRRKTLGRLLRGDGDRSLREQVLKPLVQRNIDSALSQRGGDGAARVDVVVFARQAFFQLAAALIGLDGVDDGASADELRRFYEPIQVAMGGFMDGGDRAAAIARGLEVKEAFRERYYSPACQRHIELAQAVADGTLSAEDAPKDLLMLIATDSDPAWTAEPDLAMREAMTDVLNAGTSSTSATLVWALDELLAWFAAHPAERALAADSAFLGQAVQESLRMHTTLPLFFRMAEDDVELSSGLTIRAGELVALEVDRANRDPDVFGADADRFDPYRTVPRGVYPYGVAFGSGRHMCFGLPVVLGEDGSGGSHAQIIQALFRAGVARDPERPPTKRQDTLRDVWAEYPILLGNASDA